MNKLMFKMYSVWPTVIGNLQAQLYCQCSAFFLRCKLAINYSKYLKSTLGLATQWVYVTETDNDTFFIRKAQWSESYRPPPLSQHFL